jgi:hypothetical protein
MVRDFRQHRKPEMERGLLDYLRRCDVDESAIDIVKDLFKRAPRRGKRGRPTENPRPLIAGHPRTLRRHRRKHKEVPKRVSLLRDRIELMREILAAIKPSAPDKKSMN